VNRRPNHNHNLERTSIVPSDPAEPLTSEIHAELAACYPHTDRIVVAVRLALDVETASALLQRRPVDPSRVDELALRWARRHQLVRLDLAAIDLLPDIEEVAA